MTKQDVMTKQEVFNKVKALVVENLDAGEDKITESASFANDLQADSLDIVELVMALEEKFEIEIPDEDAAKIATVGDAVAYISEKIGATA